MQTHSNVPIIKTAQPAENLSIISIQYCPDLDFCLKKKLLDFQINIFTYRKTPLLVPGLGYFQMQISLYSSGQ